MKKFYFAKQITELYKIQIQQQLNIITVIQHLFIGYRGLSRPASVFSMMMMMMMMMM